MYETILVPTDGSEGTSRTVEHAVAIARNHDATIHGVHVVDRRKFLAAAEERQDDVMADLQSEGEAAIEALREEVGDAVAVETAIREGTPHKEILAYADEIDADLVVIGTHGRTGRERLVAMGSVSEKVVKDADRPVLVVDIGEE